MPRAFKGKFHILFSHLRQLHLTFHLLSPSAPVYDVYFVDQLSTCIPFLRAVARTRVVFYCHFPDKLLADGAYAEGRARLRGGLLKRIYRFPMDWLEEATTSECFVFLSTRSVARVDNWTHFAYVDREKCARHINLYISCVAICRIFMFLTYVLGQADVILANSEFTSRIFKANFPSIPSTPKVVYPGINLSAYEVSFVDTTDPDIAQVTSYVSSPYFGIMYLTYAVHSDRPTLLSLNRFEKKKNAALAINAFALLRAQLPSDSSAKDIRLVLAGESSSSNLGPNPLTHEKPGGYDPRLEDNMMTLAALLDCAKAHALSYNVVTPSASRTNVPPLNYTKTRPDVLLLLNFSTAQRSALLSAPSTRALLYTPTNEHFGIGPVEGMLCGVPVLACNSGGPTESVVDAPPDERTGWLRPPEPQLWADALAEIVGLPDAEREALAGRARRRARDNFGMEAMSKGLQGALREATALGPVPAVILPALLMVALAILLAFLTSRL